MDPSEMPIPTDPLILNSQDRRHRDQNFAVARFTRRLWFSSPLILMLAEGLSISVVSFRKGCRPWLLPSYLEAALWRYRRPTIANCCALCRCAEAISFRRGQARRTMTFLQVPKTLSRDS